MKTLKCIMIAVAVIAVFGVSCVFGETATMADLVASINRVAPQVDLVQYYDDQDAVINLKFKPAKLRGGSSSAYLMSDFKQTSVSTPYVYVDPWSVFKGLELDYRDVSYVYGEDGNPTAIVEKVDVIDATTGTTTTIERKICDISIAKGEECRLNEDLSVISVWLSTTLIYRNKDGFDVTIVIPRVPDWDSLLASASIADGVFYGIKGGMISKARNVYDEEGRKTMGVMKMWHFDDEGKLTSTEIIKESLTYNSKGQLIAERTSQEINGALTLVKWASYAYNSDGSLRLKLQNSISYGTDGTIAKSSQAMSVFDNRGRETSYALIEYEKGHKTHSVRRTTSYGREALGEDGNVAIFDETMRLLEEEERFDDAGNSTWKAIHEKTVGFKKYLILEDGMVVDTVYKVISESWIEKGIGWENATTDKQLFDMKGRLVSHSYSYEYSYEGKKCSIYKNGESFAYSKEEETYTHTTYSSNQNYNSDGTLYYSSKNEYSEEYKNGRIVKKTSFNETQQLVNGQMVITYHNENTEEYSYDTDGDTVKVHQYGYWYSTYVDPYMDRLTTFIYNVIDGVKKLVNKHIFHIEALDKDFTQVTYSYEQDETYRYDEKGNLISKKTQYKTTYYSGDVSSTSIQKVDEAYQYDENGNLIVKSVIESSDVEITRMEVAAYTYHANGGLDTISRHVDYFSCGVPYNSEDELTQYNAQGNLVFRSFQNSYGNTYLEERTYAEDGKTLLSRDVVSHGYYRYNDIYPLEEVVDYNSDGVVDTNDLIRYPGYKDYELHEKYRPDGKIVYKAESGTNGNYWYGGPNSFSSIEKWEYADNGNLTHYEKEYSSKSYSNRWYWLNEVDYLVAENMVAKYPYGGSLDYSEKIVRDYDPETGKMVKEEYTINSERWDGLWYAIGILERYRDGQEGPSIPTDAQTLIDDIAKFFLSFNYEGKTEQKMIIEYGKDGKIQVKCVVNDGSGQAISAFSGTIEYGEDGKIKGIVFTYTGDKSEEWKTMLEGLNNLYGDIVILNKTENRPDDRIVKTEESQRADVEAAQAGQRAGCVPEIVVPNPDPFATLNQ